MSGSTVVARRNGTRPPDRDGSIGDRAKRTLRAPRDHVTVDQRGRDLINQPLLNKGTAFTDLDGDGDMDLYVVAWNVPNRVYRNDQDDKGFLKVRLAGTISNRMAVGAVARVYDAGFAEDRKHFRGVRELRTATGFCAQEGQELHFGVPAAGSYDVVVNFPSGVKVVRRGVHAGQVLAIEEPNAVAKK